MSNTPTPRPNTFKPVLVPRTPQQQQTSFEAAMELVQLIDTHLTNGTQHYRTKSGKLLRTLDQVVHAILSDNLRIETPNVGWQDELARAA